MSFSVTNQHNNSIFTTHQDETILDAALRDNRIYPYGCRSGVCGACKSNLVSGQVDYGDYEDFALTDDEKEQGKVLICQAIPLEDVVIDVKEIMTGTSIQIKMLPCRVGKINRLAQDVVQLFLTLPKTQEFKFIAGQYIDIILKDGQRRSFSIANLPENTEEEGLELHIRHVPDGHFTPRVFDSMKERDLLRFEGPFGTYFLQSDPAQPIVMIAGGTGFSPVKGLIQQALAQNPDQSIHLFWGARDEQDLYMDSIAKTWSETYPNIKYTPVLSDSTSSDWTGETGYVHEIVEKSYQNFGKFDVYASGPPIMIDAVRNSLLAKGMNQDRFFFDSFEFASPV
jgi:CDP-4-dehydro-6-deoxyglucose reductase